MNAQFVRDRISQLRIQKGVSEYQMSYDLGHSRGYVNNISSGKALPSMNELFAICEYFEITPQEFFDDQNIVPAQTRKFVESFEKLSAENAALLLALAEKLQK